jgi:hypothetical protein
MKHKTSKILNSTTETNKTKIEMRKIGVRVTLDEN